MTCLSYFTNHQGTNFKINESYTSVLLQGIELLDFFLTGGPVVD